ncbi:MAG: BtaA family protein, partial [Gemmataceae bacterium]|nr:BtaA family protein [Gemmataceae bacterium]
MGLGQWLSRHCFDWVHGHNLVYNTCWEDPRLDRQALRLGPDDHVAVITSAGCNVLDYALDQPRRIDAIDVNYRQNALLELKIAGIRALEFETFFAMFGRGYCPEVRWRYQQSLRPLLSPSARRFWDRHIDWFARRGLRSSFYYFGTAGALAWWINVYIDIRARLREAITRLLEARSLAEQQQLYTPALHAAFWSGLLRWIAGRDLTLAFLGVPPSQRRQVETTYPGGIARFIEDRITAVFSRIPLQDNYFWRLYLTGKYSADCCPEYLKRENFLRLKAGLVDCIHIHTDSFLGFLERSRQRISRFVLLDHMDWLSAHSLATLQRQWQALVNRAAPGARVLWRSGGLRVDYVNPLHVRFAGRSRRLGDLLRYDYDLAQRLHSQDR